MPLRSKATDAEFRLVVEHSPIAMILVNDAGSIDMANLAAEKLFGFTCAEMLGQPLGILLPEETPAHHHALHTEYAAAPQPRGMAPDRRLIVQHKDGSQFPVEISLNPILNGNGTKTLASITDLSARLQSEQQLQRAFEEVQQLAFYDPLTNLPNRRLLFDRLRLAIGTTMRSRKQGALLMTDIDHFKQVNDSLGHDAGDSLLTQVANRLVNSVRVCDTVARLGGDEFVVILTDLDENPEKAVNQAVEVARKIVANCNRPFTLASQLHGCRLSVGATLFGMQEQSEDDVLKRADLALYQAKSNGRNMTHVVWP